MRVLIIGGGKVGGDLAAILLSEKHEITVIEQKVEHLNILRQDLPATMLIHGNGADPLLLEKVGIAQTQVVAAVTGSDETNLVVATLARFEFRVPRVIARVNNPKNAWMFTSQMGVDVAINQSDLMAHLIAEEMSLGDMLTLLKLRKGEFSLVEEKVHPQSLAAGKLIRDIDFPPDCIATVIIRKGKLIIPHGNVALQAADEVIAVVHQSQVKQFGKLLEAD